MRRTDYVSIETKARRDRTGGTEANSSFGCGAEMVFGRGLTKFFYEEDFELKELIKSYSRKLMLTGQFVRPRSYLIEH